MRQGCVEYMDRHSFFDIFFEYFFYSRFVLKNGTLSYWKSQSEVNRKPQGQIGLGEACKISRNEGAATFEIFTGSRTYYLTADSIATMEDWIRVLQVSGSANLSCR